MRFFAERDRKLQEPEKKNPKTPPPTKGYQGKWLGTGSGGQCENHECCLNGKLNLQFTLNQDSRN